MKKYLLPGIFLTLLAPTAALAAQPGGYLGFNIGSAEVETIDESDTGYKLYGGFMFGNLGIEAAAVGLGDGYTPDRVDVSGLSIELIGHLPLGSALSAFGKFGLFFWTVDNCYSGYYYGCYGGIYDEGSDLSYGLGLQYDLASPLSLRLEWQNYTDVSGSDISLVSGGLIYRFGY